MPDLSIIIVSWNVKDKLQKNLEHLFNSRGNFEMEVFVVDNNSQDDSAEMVNKNFEQVRLIRNTKNLGFAKANNQAIKRAQGRYILLLNPDMRVYSDTLEKMLSFMDDRPGVGIGGCLLENEKKEIVPHIRRFPKLKDQLAIVLKLPHIYPKILDNYLQSDFDYSKESEVDSIRGSFFMIRKETLKQVGDLDERFFIWFEEVDYCRRCKQSGWKTMYNPQARCIDYVGRSFSLLKRGVTQEYFRDSMLKYFRKWHPWWQYVVLYVAWMPVLVFLRLVRKN